MNTYTFQWRADTYRLDGGTLAFWPNARIVYATDDAQAAVLTTTDAIFCRYVLEQLNADQTTIENEVSIEQGVLLLEERGITVRSVSACLACIREFPGSSEAQQLMACLSQWYFVTKI